MIGMGKSICHKWVETVIFVGILSVVWFRNFDNKPTVTQMAKVINLYLMYFLAFSCQQLLFCTKSKVYQPRKSNALTKHMIEGVRSNIC